MSTTFADRRAADQRRERQPDSDGTGPRRGRLGLTRRAWVITGIVTSIVVVFAAWLFYFSSAFALESLVIEGVKNVTPEDVRAAAELQTGVPLARVDVGAVQARVQSLVSVASVRVTRGWPHSISISIVERDRVASVLADEKYSIIDSTGFTFAPAKKRPAGLPLLQTTEPGPARDAALAVLTAIPDELLQQIDKVEAEGADSVVLTMRNGTTVVWGSADRSDLKAKVLLALMAKIKDKWIDLRTPDTPSSAQSSPKPAPPPITESPTPTPSASPTPSTGEPVPGSSPGSGATPSAAGAIPAPSGLYLPAG